MLCGRPIVVAEDPADSPSATNRANRSLRGRRIDQLVRKPLVIPLAMVVHSELLQCSPQMPFTERHDAIEAFLLHRPDEPLRVGVAIRRTGRRPNDTHTGRAQPLLNGAAPLRVAIAEQ